MARLGYAIVLGLDQARERMETLAAEGWSHTATIEPAVWIAALLNATPEKASDMMDELTLKP